MNGKLIVILSILIIIISSIGLISQKQKNQSSNVAKHNKYSIFVLAKDIKKGEILKSDDIKIEQKELNDDYLKDSLIVDKNLEFIVGYSLNKDLSAKSLLRYEDLLKSQIIDDALDISVNGELPFSFKLDDRGFNILKTTKKGELVDVYFKYEKKQKNADTGIVSRSDNLNKSNKDSANLTNLVLFFENRRLLNKTDENDNKEVILQMSADEIKTIYAIENVGNFYMFPAEQNKKEIFSAKKILSKDFINELRGDDK